MLEILKMQPLITNILVVASSNMVRFEVDEIQGMAKDFAHSICIGLFLLEKNGLPDTALQHVTLLLASIEETKDYALQLGEDGWWLWRRYDSDSKTDEVAVLLEQLVALNRYLVSQVPMVTSFGGKKTGGITA
ncbi:type III effector [Candidatus Fukatsuia symbiotica]|uniref:Type III effector n=1 Tax=Candidatus Fukatsuia symbiotica TaxID=1878942 RepID=A0A2U8I4D1_9GAMM|nr:type III effector [Candidatus Fukatsuia symbiotica]AWK13978.1 type III effector [Candidatus Fukatsuia symbiotica]MEA9445678.1 type III effector [Candidatus Fukatsuia symbiotica]